MKKIIKLLLPSILLSSSLIGCNSNNISEEDIATVKSWVNALQIGIKSRSNKGFTTSLKEKYNVQYSIDNEMEKSDFSIDYEAEGSLVFTYLLADDYEGEVNLGNIFQYGKGYFAGEQKEKTAYYSKTVSKQEESEPLIAELDYDINHQYVLKYDEDKLYTTASNVFKNNKNHSEDINGEFKAEINKEYIDETGSMYVEKLMNDVLFLNVWTSINEFANLTNAFYEGLTLNNDEEVKEFIRSLDIKIKENEEVIEINFDVDVDKVIYQRLQKESHLNALIHSKNIINKNTNSVSYYSYDFKDVLTSTLQEGAKTKNEFKANVDTFFIEGKMLKYNDVDQKIDSQLTTYDDTTIKEFYIGFNEYVIPYHN